MEQVDYRPLAESRDPFDDLKHNLHEFFNNVYKYYEQKGFWHILLARVLSTIAVEFAIALLFFIFFCVDFNQFTTSKDLSTAVHLPATIPSTVVAAMASIVFLYQVVQTIRITIKARRMRNYFHEVLRLSDADTQTSPWSEVVNRLRQDRLDGIPKTNITSLDIIKIMMREENYLIGMINKDIINFSLPCAPTTLVTQVIEWGLYWILRRAAFDHYGVLRSDFLDAQKEDELVRQLNRRARVTGFLFLCASPMILAVWAVYAFFSYTAQIKASPNILGSRMWSALARWKFRNFNEVPSALNNRLNKTYEFAEKYVDQFQSPALTVFARFGMFVVGAIVAILLVITLIWDHLLEATVAGRSVLWILGVGGAVVGALRSLLPPDNFVYEPNVLMEEICKHTNYIPLDWIDRAHTEEVRSEFLSYFQYKIVVFFMEILSVVFAPFVFIFSIPKCSRNVVRFFREMSVEENGLGHMCKLATFDLAENGNEEYGALPSTKDRRKVTENGKLEMSVIAFKANYPDWEPHHDATRRYLQGVLSYGRSQEFTEAMEQKAHHLKRMTRPAGFFDLEMQNQEALAAQMAESVILMQSDRVRRDRAVQSRFGAETSSSSSSSAQPGGVHSL